jgi:uncharacterized membrane protein YccC
MTIAIVLKPDFTATFTRGVLRLIGTVVGLLMATALFHVLPPGLAPQVALIAVWMFVMRCFGGANYGILVTAVTALVVLLIAMTGVSPKGVMAARALNSAAGGAIALMAYWLWPTWERTQVGEAMAQMLDAYRDYFRVIKESYVHLDTRLGAEFDRARAAGRWRVPTGGVYRSIERGAGHFDGKSEGARGNTGQLAPAGARHDGARGRVTD